MNIWTDRQIDSVLIILIFIYLDPCSIHYTCTNCNSSLYDCVWSNDHCIQPNDTTFYNTCDSHEMMCSQFTDCIGCEVQNDCTWNNSRCVNGNNGK